MRTRVGLARRARPTPRAGAVLVVVLMSLTPTDAQGHTTGTAGHIIAPIGTLLILTLVSLACLQQAALRRQVYPRPETGQPVPGPVLATGNDPAVAAVLAARARRAEARRLAERDPLMARELRIGRPDLPRDYDDGGLVDLNNAPAAVLAERLELDPSLAAAIVTARTEHGGFLAVEDVFTLTELPLGCWDLIRDRGIVLAR
ncbi:ComEA family DNA-binding protein, partial [Amycolatopsis rhizosphaerae]|uniref:ComEA family DNA-binding protein n=1 Tax=Amycolatopsis rhizosphaerae TaxID=2053003 RepID=UPI001643D7A8